jgi:hypothetical protein
MLQVTAAIVTCGGLCPGLNDVVQNLVYTLSDYGVPEDQILGIRYCSTGNEDLAELHESCSLRLTLPPSQPPLQPMLRSDQGPPRWAFLTWGFASCLLLHDYMQCM